MDTIQIDIQVTSIQQSEIVIAELSEKGFHGFQENNNNLSAFVNENLFDEHLLQALFSPLNLSYTKKIIADRNWNQKWETEFRPVVIGSFVAVRAAFHSPIKEVEHEIIITPKMSFGTGHHATTYLMLQQMKEIDFKNKSVLDFGTGTGILAILANKLGAHVVTAIDNDEWSIENAKENIENNDCKNISLIQNDSISGLGPFDIILANINLNIIKDNITGLKRACHSLTKILLSGFLLSDESELKRIFSFNALQIKNLQQKEGWICISLFVEK